MNGVAQPTLLGRWLESCKVYADRRVLSILFFGFSSGLPLGLTFGTLSVWLAEVGVSKTTIGLFALMGTPYTLKFLWAPLVDRMPIPFLTRWLGRRRAWTIVTQLALMVTWTIVTQLALMVTITGLGATNPVARPGLTAVFAFLVAFWSATQDIVIDAYRVEILEERQYGAGAATIVLGYRIGMLVSGAGALYLATGRRGWMVILLFILLYKFGDALAGVMTMPFYVELGFTKAEIASISKIFGMAAIIIGAVIGGVIVDRFGILKSLFVCGILQMFSNLMFAVLAMVGHDLRVLTLAIAVENLSGGMGTAAFVAYLSSLCNVAYTATQYALLTSFMAFGRTVLTSSGGWLADQMNWVSFFVLTTIAALPGLLLLVGIARRFAAPISVEGVTAKGELSSSKLKAKSGGADSS
jgi:PAT family beta-lactamase induction signal transducer AmpG